MMEEQLQQLVERLRAVRDEPQRRTTESDALLFDVFMQGCAADEETTGLLLVIKGCMESEFVTSSQVAFALAVALRELDLRRALLDSHVRLLDSYEVAAQTFEGTARGTAMLAITGLKRILTAIQGGGMVVTSLEDLVGKDVMEAVEKHEAGRDKSSGGD